MAAADEKQDSVEHHGERICDGGQSVMGVALKAIGSCCIDVGCEGVASADHTKAVDLVDGGEGDASGWIKYCTCVVFRGNRDEFVGNVDPDCEHGWRQSNLALRAVKVEIMRRLLWMIPRGQLLKMPFWPSMVLQSPCPRRGFSDQVVCELVEYCEILSTLVSTLVAFVRMGLKGPVQRILGSAKSRTMITVTTDNLQEEQTRTFPSITREIEEAYSG